MAAYVNEKGQAAVTDALFMLLIVSGLAVMLFVFTAGYGNDISQHLLRQYSVDYTTDSLKTILYSSTPRFPGQDLTAPNVEVDYLLAVVKEDFAEQLSFSPDTKKVLRDNIDKIMRPVSDQFDYMFIVVKQREAEYIFTMIYKSEFICKNQQKVEIDCESGARDVIVEPALISHQFYDCENVDSQKISRLVYELGESSQANSPLLLLQSSKTVARRLETADAQATLVIWPATLISDERITEMGCEVMPD